MTFFRMTCCAVLVLSGCNECRVENHGEGDLCTGDGGLVLRSYPGNGRFDLDAGTCTVTWDGGTSITLEGTAMVCGTSLASSEVPFAYARCDLSAIPAGTYSVGQRQLVLPALTEVDGGSLPRCF